MILWLTFYAIFRYVQQSDQDLHYPPIKITVEHNEI